MSQMTHDLHFGLGTAHNIDSIVVVWPGNSVTRHIGITPHSYVELTSDGKSTVVVDLRPVNLRPASGSIGIRRSDEFVWAGTAGSSATIEITPLGGTGGTPIIRQITTGSRSAVDLPDGLYSWRVITGKGASQPWTLRVGDPVPSVPTIISPLPGATVATTTTLRWTRSTYDLQGAFTTRYRVRLQNTISKVPEIILDTLTTDTTLALSGLPAAATLSLSIKAIFRADDAPDSALVNFLSYNVPQAPSAVFPANGASGVTTRPKFQWSRPEFVDKGFEVEVDTLESFTTSTTRKATDTSLTWTPPLKAGKVYYWRSRGNNLAGIGLWSSTAAFTTAGITSVNGDDPTSPCTGRLELYDLRGRLIATVSSTDGIEQSLMDFAGVILVVHRSANGSVCQTEVRVQ